MKSYYRSLISMLFLVIILSGCSVNDQTTAEDSNKQDTSKDKVELTVSAAASLQDAMTNIKADFEKENPNIILNFNFGGSGALQQQISQGAPVDVFISAAEDKFQVLVDDGLIDKSDRTDLVGNELVLVVPKESNNRIKGFEELTKAGKIALGTPETVPAGQYGKDTLENLKLWSEIEDKVIFAKDVRQVLTYVETNNVDAGIVYKTDALTSDKVEIAATAEENTHDPIIYPAGIIKDSSHYKEAKTFYDYLQTDASLKTLEHYGFRRP